MVQNGMNQNYVKYMSLKTIKYIILKIEEFWMKTLR